MNNEFFRFVNVSGGKDSLATYLWCMDQGFEFRAVMADTDHENPVTPNFARNIHEFTGGPEVEIVKADFSERLKKKGIEPTGNAFFDMILWKGRVPSSRAQFCTEEMKLKPIRDWLIRERKGIPSISYVGIRAGESKRRAKLPEQELNEYMDSLVVRPILRWSEEDVFNFLKKKNIKPNPLYDLGYKRVGCFPCINASKTELSRLPGWAWDKIENWENRLGRTWFSFGTIPLRAEQKTQIRDAERSGDEDKVKELKNLFSPKVHEVREWAKTMKGGRQFGFFPIDEKDSPSCFNTWGHCE